MSNPAARVVGLTKTYGTGEARIVALDDVTLDLAAGEFTAVMGPSGSGKSTLMHCCAALDTADEGSVFIGDQDLTKLKDKALTRLRRDQIGFVFQSYNLVPTLTAQENIVLPLAIAGRKPDAAWYDEVIATVGLGDRLAHKPNELSGGQQQRVAVARALVSRPTIVFADEPTGNLDSRSGAEVLELLRCERLRPRPDGRDGDPRPGRGVVHGPGRVPRRRPDRRRGPRPRPRPGARDLGADDRRGRRRLRDDDAQGHHQEPARAQAAPADEHVRDRAGGRVRRRLADLLRHPGPQLHGAVRVDRRRRGRAARGRRSRTGRLDGDHPCVRRRGPRVGPGGRARRRQRDGVRGLRRRQGQQGRRRPGTAGDRRQLLRRTGGSRSSRSRPDRGPAAARSRRGGLRRQDRPAVGLRHRREGAHRHLLGPGPADPEARRHPRLPSKAARSTAPRSRRSTSRRLRACSSGARTPSPTSG